MSRDTLVERKEHFLRQQKQILSQGITQSNRLSAIADQADIQEKVWIDVIRKVNRDLKRHGKEVYGKQMRNHVVEQIDLLYWEAGAPSLESELETPSITGTGDSSTLYQGDDLTLDKHIVKLPTSLHDLIETSSVIDRDGGPADEDMYMETTTRLHDLSARRLTLRQKLTTYRTLLSLLEPYRNPSQNVQPNLVGRDAPLAAELAKTRTLAIRVAGRVSEKLGGLEVHSAVESSDEEMTEDNGNVKLNNILSNW